MSSWWHPGPDGWLLDEGNPAGLAYVVPRGADVAWAPAGPTRTTYCTVPAAATTASTETATGSHDRRTHDDGVGGQSGAVPGI